MLDEECSNDNECNSGNCAKKNERDPKGLYLKAKQGLIQNFTGINDPFEEPTHSDLILNNTNSLENITNILNEKFEKFLK